MFLLKLRCQLIRSGDERENMNGIFISNDINCPCNIKKCTSETIQSCYGCPEWFAWLYDIEQSDKRNPKQAYVGKHLKRIEELEK